MRFSLSLIAALVVLLAMTVACGGEGKKTEPVAEEAEDVASLALSRVPHDEAVFGGGSEMSDEESEMSDVVAGGPGLVAVGSYSITHMETESSSIVYAGGGRVDLAGRPDLEAGARRGRRRQIAAV